MTTLKSLVAASVAIALSVPFIDIASAASSGASKSRATSSAAKSRATSGAAKSKATSSAAKSRANSRH